jgi:hypothetical protein
MKLINDVIIVLTITHRRTTNKDELKDAMEKEEEQNKAAVAVDDKNENTTPWMLPMRLRKKKWKPTG